MEKAKSDHFLEDKAACCQLPPVEYQDRVGSASDVSSTSASANRQNRARSEMTRSWLRIQQEKANARIEGTTIRGQSIATLMLLWPARVLASMLARNPRIAAEAVAKKT